MEWDKVKVMSPMPVRYDKLRAEFPYSDQTKTEIVSAKDCDPVDSQLVGSIHEKNVCSMFINLNYVCKDSGVTSNKL